MRNQENGNNETPLKVAVTGGIGTGKSTVCRLFEVLGVPVYHSDARAKQLMVVNKGIIEQLKTEFGEDIYHSDGTVNKSKLSGLIFTNELARARVNSIVHPVVWNDFDQWSESFAGQHKYVIQESALVFEAKRQTAFSYVVTTICSLDEKVNRVINRDRCSFQQALNRIQSQIPDEEKARRSSFVVDTSLHNMIINEVININNKIINSTHK